MKNIFALMVFSFFSASTFAATQCPNLVGNWKCQNADSSTSAFSIAQYDIQNGVYYQLTAPGEKLGFMADGVPRTYTDDKGSIEILAQCTDSATVHLEIKAVSLDQKSSALEELDIISIDAGNMRTHGTLTENQNGQTSTKDLASRCFNVHE